MSLVSISLDEIIHRGLTTDYQALPTVDLPILANTGTALPMLLEEVRGLIRECGAFTMRKVPGHAGHPENEHANELAVKAALTGQMHRE